MIELITPLMDFDIDSLKVGDIISISGHIFTGRDAALPKIVKTASEGKLSELGIDLQGSVIFHTAVSPAGVGPTSSNKLEIESSFEPLSKAYGLPKNTEEEKRHKDEVMEKCLHDAAQVPLEIMRKIAEIVPMARTFADKGSVIAVSDAGV